MRTDEQSAALDRVAAYDLVARTDNRPVVDSDEWEAWCWDEADRLIYLARVKPDGDTYIYPTTFYVPENDMPDMLRSAFSTGRVTNPPGKSEYHGVDHWKSVALVGLWLARRTTERASLSFVYTFALLHDLCRLHDSNPGEGDDAEHGFRAAEMFEQMVMSPGVEEFPPYTPWTDDMIFALQHHVGTKNARDGDPSVRVNVGLCWDADRLTLWRVGIEPDERYLTTDAARQEDASMYGKALAMRQLRGEPFPTWAQIRKAMEMMRWP